LRVGFELLQRSLEALNPHDFLKSKPDLWLYFYEDFLAAYDPKLRKDFGVYYTPREVVELQVRLVSELLEQHFDKRLGFADDGVVFLDPSVGTGTYPVAAVTHALGRVRARSGEGAVAGRADQMAQNMYGFEILVGPYAVSHLRLSQALESSGATISGRLRIYLADTLESPNATPPGGLSLTYKTLTQEHEAARKLKNEGDILVCLGNPPYDRQQIEEGDISIQRKGGWVRFGDQVKGGAKQEKQGELPIFDDFLEPARIAGAGVHLKNLYNDYVYFWRWALWRLFEKQDGGGIVSFITASSYLAGPGFVGMREVMRRTFDELWILDLGGDNLGTRKTPNVFNIQTPVAIAIGVRGKVASPDTPAKVHYAKLVGSTREAKLVQLNGFRNFASFSWKLCPKELHAPFLPAGKGDYFSWPKIDQIFAWHFSGVEVGRNWCIAESRELLLSRWKIFLNDPSEALFSPSRDTHLSSEKCDIERGEALVPINKLTPASKLPKNHRYSFRSFDNQYEIIDPRFCNWPRPDAQKTWSENQIYFAFLLTEMVGKGPAIVASSSVPDRYSFHGRSGRFVSLFRDGNCTEPNVPAGLLDVLGKAYRKRPSAEDLAAYVYALLGGCAYTNRFGTNWKRPALGCH
jgi:hypothetical protein